MAQYLRRLWTSFLTIFLRLDRVPAVVSSVERVSRFVFYQRHIKTGEISAAAFMPGGPTQDTSVYRTSGCSEKRVWLLGDLFVERLRKDGRAFIARGDVIAKAVFDQHLKIASVPRPHPRHAVVCNWPEDKAHQKIKAEALALEATLLLRPPSGRQVE